MITDSRQLDRLAEKLEIYDIDQQGWEMEQPGFEFVDKARHVLYHLVKTVTQKDFANEEVVLAEIAPDSVQHALRLTRWVNVTPEDLAKEENRAYSDEPPYMGLSSTQIHYRRFESATATLSAHLHDLDHAKSAERALEERDTVIKRAAGLLLLCANGQSLDYSFNLALIFDKRLANLRETYSIPEPSIARPLH